MKRFKRFLGRALSGIILATTPVIASNTSKLAVVSEVNVSDNNDLYKAEEKSWKKYDKVFLDKQYKSKENYSKIVNFVKKSKSEGYQDYYGGSYIDGNGDLIVHSELPPLIEVGASWSIFPTEQVYPSSKGRTDLDSTKII